MAALQLDVANLVYEATRALTVLEGVAYAQDGVTYKKEAALMYVRLKRAIERAGGMDD
jgi:hypothetical protein